MTSTIFNNRQLVLHVATFMNQLDIFKLCLTSSVTRKIILTSNQIPLYHRIKLMPLHKLIEEYHLDESILRCNIDVIKKSPYIKSLLAELDFEKGYTENHKLLKQYCSCIYGELDSTHYFGVSLTWKMYHAHGTTYYKDDYGNCYAIRDNYYLNQSVKNATCNICQIRNTLFAGNCFECKHMHKFKRSTEKS
ncbi:MAG: hypothetical protein Faunusvirus2_48 [Faunusvirus sp.]|jgi:hypothetical protein|uniref:Uncharacterized protein n=1 Tax=Faunusvirus sp. TaxID=2487766 RepID=A0A3G4ZYM6_9VIRU|nr:MAG: hypothetical protein Faunusvirus2_48 [Faunusvirus sp.]